VVDCQDGHAVLLAALEMQAELFFESSDERDAAAWVGSARIRWIGFSSAASGTDDAAWIPGKGESYLPWRPVMSTAGLST